MMKNSSHLKSIYIYQHLYLETNFNNLNWEISTRAIFAPNVYWWANQSRSLLLRDLIFRIIWNNQLIHQRLYIPLCTHVHVCKKYRLKWGFWAEYATSHYPNHGWSTFWIPIHHAKLSGLRPWCILVNKSRETTGNKSTDMCYKLYSKKLSSTRHWNVFLFYQIIYLPVGDIT